MLLFFVRWKTVNEWWWHALGSESLSTLRKARFFRLCTRTHTSTLSRLLFWRLHLADLFILCRENLSRLNPLPCQFYRLWCSKALLFSQLERFLLLSTAEHMDRTSISCRLSINHLWKNVRGIAHTWPRLRPSTRSTSFSIAFGPASLQTWIQSVSLWYVWLLIPSNFLLLSLLHSITTKEALAIGPLKYRLSHHFLTNIVNFFLWII